MLDSQQISLPLSNFFEDYKNLELYELFVPTNSCCLMGKDFFCSYFKLKESTYIKIENFLQIVYYYYYSRQNSRQIIHNVVRIK